MQAGMIGLGRMGADMLHRLREGGHDCHAYDIDRGRVAQLAAAGISATSDLAAFVGRLTPPRTIWLMVPAGAVDGSLEALLPLLGRDDVVIDGGNSWYGEARPRAARLAARGFHFVDCGTSGGIFGRERGYCLMLGGDATVVARLDPLFATLAPGRGAAPRTPGRADPGGTAEDGYLHCGPHGAGHFVKMVHNGIEYGIMAAIGEGFDLLHRAGAGAETRPADAESAPLRDPDAYRYDFDLPEIAELWRRGSVIASWLLDLGAAAFADDPELAAFHGRVSDSGEGRWALEAAVEIGAPAPVLAAALFARFQSQGAGTFQARLLSAMRARFGGHQERPSPPAR